MSRKNAKLAVLHDLQSRQSDVILTKKNCDMIAKAIMSTYDINSAELTREMQGMQKLYYYLKGLSRK
jgi:hypothetical protein